MIHTLDASQNAFRVQIVLRTKFALEINVSSHALECVHQTLNAMFIIIFQFAHVLKELQEMRLLDVMCRMVSTYISIFREIRLKYFSFNLQSLFPKIASSLTSFYYRLYVYMLVGMQYKNISIII